MRIRAGYKISYVCSAPTPMLFMGRVHPTRAADLIEPERFSIIPRVHCTHYVDGFGNICTRLVVPDGHTRLNTDFVIADRGEPEPLPLGEVQVPIEELPDDTLVFLFGSRYCETDELMKTAWSRFGDVTPGWPRLEAILQYVHDHIQFDYAQARASRTAHEAHEERVGVCRDFAHLAITFCRCMNIPARYCTGYLGDIGVLPDPAPMDFSAWFEAFLGGSWYAVDARHLRPRIGRILIARGRDANDVAISTAFGSAKLQEFKVITEEL